MSTRPREIGSSETWGKSTLEILTFATDIVGTGTDGIANEFPLSPLKVGESTDAMTTGGAETLGMLTFAIDDTSEMFPIDIVATLPELIVATLGLLIVSRFSVPTVVMDGHQEKPLNGVFEKISTSRRLLINPTRLFTLVMLEFTMLSVVFTMEFTPESTVFNAVFTLPTTVFMFLSTAVTTVFTLPIAVFTAVFAVLATLLTPAVIAGMAVLNVPTTPLIPV
jgi:hypothetical protein